ncbi:class I adenylate-forming enzyme family protein [Butyrivibrio sp. AE3006]|uniref:class I adenylate-forming enzyme family protein n=1 Tax=Butyrivibrio sp. AE3006 TaxID=1280673 RepID=UPI0009DC3065|nr:class I adenylate-forming enzyme family protein [Butyrivibrio sp. AE3006]
MEKKLNEHTDIPAIEYFGKVISRKEFIENVYLWAKAFRNLGVKEDEIVAYYGPFMPDVCYMIFALNMIGACPYFLKLAISSKVLEEEAKECRIAIVFDQMWENVKGGFTKDKYEKVIIARITDAMPTPKKQIVSVMTKIRKKTQIPRGEKYISVSDAKELGKGYNGEIKAPFVSNRNAFITSSSGTTVGGIVKGVVATNETVLTQLSISDASGTQFFKGERCLNHFPPTAATSLNLLFSVPLYRGMTVVMDPRVEEKDFYNQITKLHVNAACSTGSAWEAFFNRLEKERAKGKEFDFSYVKCWVVGGEGTDSKKFQKWQNIMHELGSDRGLASGYGSSELFASACSESVNARYDFSKPIMSVGIPMAGITVGVFDEEGKELGYNQKGELWIRSKSVMKCYYNKPELTAKTKVDGWIHTGDLAEIDENGFVYILGRVKDTTLLPDGRKIYLFDIAHRIKEKNYIDDAIVLEKPIKQDSISLVAHIVWEKSVKEDEKVAYLKALVECVEQYEPGVELIAFAIHDVMLPYSPTTLKKDKNRMMNQLDGFVWIVDDQIQKIRFVENGYGLYEIEKSTLKCTLCQGQI